MSRCDVVRVFVCEARLGLAFAALCSTTVINTCVEAWVGLACTIPCEMMSMLAQDALVCLMVARQVEVAYF